MSLPQTPSLIQIQLYLNGKLSSQTRPSYYHMNKNHWNTVKTHGNIPDKLLEEWIRKSYDLVISGLTKKLQKELAEE